MAQAAADNHPGSLHPSHIDPSIVAEETIPRAPENLDETSDNTASDMNGELQCQLVLTWNPKRVWDLEQKGG
jgi:hypothetical protein